MRYEVSLKYCSFEELPVWNDAIRLAKLVFDLSESGVFRRVSGFKDQVERAVVSVSNNIAEGFERGTTEELVAFLYIAKGSVAEVRSMLHLLDRTHEDLPAVADLATPTNLSVSISKQLRGWIDSLRSSGIHGSRSLDERGREQRDQKRRADAFLQTLQQVQADALSRRLPKSNNDAPEL